MESLNEALRDGSYEVRWDAAKALDELGWKPDTTELMGVYLIAKRDWDECAKLGEPAVKPLAEALDRQQEYILELWDSFGGSLMPSPPLWDENHEILEAIVSTLGKTGAAGAVNPLINTFRNYSELTHELHEYAVAALKNIGESATGKLVELLSARESTARGCAARVLSELGWKPESDRRRTDFLVAEEKWDDLVIMGEAALESLIDALDTMPAIDAGGDEPHVESDLRVGAAKTLGEIGDARAVEPLIKALYENCDEDPEYHNIEFTYEGVEALGKISSTRAEKFIKALEDEDEDDRYAVAAALKKLGYKIKE
jgi:HEAT repeat protein